jgi:hypothetical protein
MWLASGMFNPVYLKSKSFLQCLHLLHVPKVRVYECCNHYFQDKNTYAGSFIYHLDEGPLVSIGYVVSNPTSMFARIVTDCLYTEISD